MFASEWNELTARQFVGIVNLLHLRDLSSKYDFRNRVVAVMLGDKNIVKKLIKASYLVELATEKNKKLAMIQAKDAAACQLVQLWRLFEWVEEDILLTKNLLPRLRVGFFGGYLYGPGDGLANMTAMEWTWVDSFYMAYRADGKLEDLLGMVACMYRPRIARGAEKRADWDGDLRVGFNSTFVDKRVDLLMRLFVYKKGALRLFVEGLMRFFGRGPLNDGRQKGLNRLFVDLFKWLPGEVELLAVFHWYESCRHDVELRHPRVFSADNEQKAESFGWQEVFLKISKEGVFGSFAAVSDEAIDTILLHMEIGMKDEAERERKRVKELKS